MLVRLFGELGPWNWMVLGAFLLGIEILVPGFFLIWIGLAALVTGALSLFFWDAGFWVWQVQIVLFLALSLVAAYGGNRLMQNSGDGSDEPLLNRRGDQLIGRTATLEQPIAEGRGRIRIDDTVWRVKGPDLAVGVKVRVVAAHGGDLVVQVA